MDISLILLQLSLAQQAIAQASYLAVSADECPDCYIMMDSIKDCLDSCLDKVSMIKEHIEYFIEKKIKENK